MGTSAFRHHCGKSRRWCQTHNPSLVTFNNKPAPHFISESFQLLARTPELILGMVYDPNAFGQTPSTFSENLETQRHGGKKVLWSLWSMRTPIAGTCGLLSSQPFLGKAFSHPARADIMTSVSSKWTRLLVPQLLLEPNTSHFCLVVWSKYWFTQE